jgi:hypothetical protein
MPLKSSLLCYLAFFSTFRMMKEHYFMFSGGRDSGKKRRRGYKKGYNSSCGDYGTGLTLH